MPRGVHRRNVDYAGPTSIRLPTALLQAVDRLAVAETRSRTEQVIHMLREAITARGLPDPLVGEEER